MLRSLYVFFLFVFFVLSKSAFTQYHDYGFEKSYNIVVKNQLGDTLKNPWLGGLNSCQYHEIDLNFDGIKDMLVFDRTGNRLLTFINNGTPNSIDYTHAPEYEKFFPPIHDWIFIQDYNNDGKEDIFTYFIGGMSVYRNDSDTLNGLVFTKMTDVLNSLQYSNYLNLFVSEVEMPAIADVNGDGCVDILVFHILGSYLNLHTNQSMIKYGHCDSLDFVRTHHCWGNFFESENSADLTLNISCPFTKDVEDKSEKEILHVGSTMAVLDLDSNGLMDLLLSDTDFPNFIAAYNGGTLQEAHITHTETNFPSNSLPLELYSMPLPSLIDINNNGKKDLIASPFDANYLITESKESNWLYENTGTPQLPVFEFRKKNFLQEEMIELGTGAYPVLYDMDKDGLPDLFISNYGYRDTSYYENGFLYSTFISNIMYYKNTGSLQKAEFLLVDADFANISSLGLKAVYPAFGDIDGDGDTDMIIGEDNGTLLFFENIAGSGNNPVFATPVSNYQSIDVGRFSTPQLIDLDRDSLIDLVIGDRRGRLNYYKNAGTINNPVFSLITDTLGGVLVKVATQSNYGYSVPCFFQDSLDNYRLFVGSESGRIFYYDSIDNNLDGIFNLKEEHLLLIYEGIRTGVAVGSLIENNYMDMLIGNFSGGLNFYAGKTPNLIAVNEPIIPLDEFLVYPNPANDFLNIECKNVSNFPHGFHYYIYDIRGQLLLNKFVLSHNISIDINKFKSGLYIVKLQTGNSVSVKKIVVN